MTTDPADAALPSDIPGPEEGGGPPLALPWTLVIEDEHWSADLEHGALLPRIGERVDYINELGEHRTYRVREVVHTVQPSASERPPVRDAATSPNATVNEADPGRIPTELRAGLPRVFVVREQPG